MMWFYEDSGRQMGPITDADLQRLVRSGTITASTLVWKEGMAQWAPYGSVLPASAPPPIRDHGSVINCAACGRPFPQAQMVFSDAIWRCASCASASGWTASSAPQAGAGVWRAVDTLVMSKLATLPDSCIKCGLPTSPNQKLGRTLYWHHPGYYALILVSILVYAIVALCVRKTVKLQVGLCDQHRSARRKMIALSWGISLSGIPVTILGAGLENVLVVVLGVLLMIGGLIFAAVKVPVVRPSRIDDRFAWIKGASPEYLRALPDWTGPVY